MEIFLKLEKQTKPLCQLPVLGKLHSLSLFFFPPLQKLTLSAIILMIELIILVYKWFGQVVGQVVSKC